MSDTSQGPGWRIASDGKWYPPETAPTAPTSPTVPTAAAAPAVEPTTADEGGRGKFGDGVSGALYEFQESRFKGGRLFTPNVIRVWPDRIEEYEHHAIRKKGTQAISFQQVSEVSMSRGLVWSDVSVESTGGKSITMDGIPKGDADRVKKMIDDAVFASKRGPVSAPVAAAAPDLADQLRKLADLRDQGILTEDEFSAQKARLLGA
jgi:hypothetical protein